VLGTSQGNGGFVTFCRIASSFACFALLAASACAPASAAERPGPDTPLTRIAVGSCAKQDRPQPIWDAVLGARPELFLFVGDNIYGDTLDVGVLREKYAQLGAVPGFAKLRARSRVLATWDDHDYGANDAGAEYPEKVESQKAFLDFFEEPADSPRRKQEGVYAAETFGPEGRRVQVILLDTRYFRSPLQKKATREPGTGPYEASPDPEATLLGEAQWAWLAERLREPAELRVIASSIQVVAADHGWEKWANFPRERQRLFDLITDANANGVIILSGDRHTAELSVERQAGPYPLYDLTASSLNNPLKPTDAIEGNTRRLGEVYRGENFGTVTIDWDQPDPRIGLKIVGLDGKEVVAHEVRLSELRAK
jgi:alkaline phosphatase D